MTTGQALAMMALFAVIAYAYWIYQDDGKKDKAERENPGIAPKILAQINGVKPHTPVRCRECRGVLWHNGRLPPCPDCRAWNWTVADFSFPGDTHDG